MISLATSSGLCRNMTKKHFFSDVLHFNYFKRNQCVEGLEIEYYFIHICFQGMDDTDWC